MYFSAVAQNENSDVLRWGQTQRTCGGSDDEE